MTWPSPAHGGRLAVAGGAFVVLAAACSDIPTDPTEPFSIAFDRLPFPAVAAGDTLRDVNGVAVPLQATVYNGAGEVIPDAPVRFRLLDPGATVDPASGFVVGQALASGALGDDIRVIAEIGDLQTPPLRFDVARRPDSLHLPDTAIAPALWSIPSTAADTSEPLQARVLHRPAAGGEPVPVGSWRVRYALSVNGEPATDSTLLFWFVAEAGTRASAVDTTDAQGLAVRKLRINGNEAAALASVDSVRVIVTVEGSAPLAAKPDTLVVPIRRRSTGS